MLTADKDAFAKVLHEVFDVRNALMDLVYPFRKVTRSEKEFELHSCEVLEQNLPKAFGKLDSFLSQCCKGPFVGGDKPAPSDFHLFGEK